MFFDVQANAFLHHMVRNVVGTSLKAAQAYKEEHRQDLSRDGAALAAFLEAAQTQAVLPMEDGQLRETLGRFQTQIDLSLSEAFVIDASGAEVNRMPWPRRHLSPPLG